MDKPAQAYRWIGVRNCQAFLWAMYAEYEGLSVASFEGQLAPLHLHEIPGASDARHPWLPNEIDGPGSDYWTMPINATTIAMLKAKLSGPRVLGQHGIVVHTHLATEGRLILSACDQFHKECVRVSPDVPLSLLDRLLANGVLSHI